MPRSLPFLFFLSLSQFILGQGQPKIDVQISSNYLIVGEEATLTLTPKNIAVSSWPTSPSVTPLSLRQKGYVNSIIGRRVSKSFTYSISGMREGTYQIPSFRIGNAVSNTVQVTIFARSQLTPKIIKIDGRIQKYYTATFVNNTSPFLGETQPIEARVYLPDELGLERMFFADFDKGKFVAWRFDPNKESGSDVRIDGIKHRSFSYSSSITPLAEGIHSFGPGRSSVVIKSKVVQRGRLTWKYSQAELKFPAVDLNVQRLPKPAPPGFNGAVGNFIISSTSEATEITVGDAVTVELSVIGSGNLDQLSAPYLIDDKKLFKQFDTSKKPQGTERRSTTGTVNFSQIIRPQKVTDLIPQYQLIFFDPILKEYQSATSSTIPLSIQPAASPQDVISAETSQIALTFLIPSRFIIPAESKPIPIWLWQIIPALLALYLVQTRLFPKLREHRAETLIQKKFKSELAEVLTATGRPELYRRATKLIEQWSSKSNSPELEGIIATRDEICYHPEETAEPVLPKERGKIGDLLKRLTPIIIFLFALTPANSQAEDWHKIVQDSPTPEAFYNLGLVEKEAGNLTNAALYLYRHKAYRNDDDAALNLLLSQTGGYRLTQPYGMAQISILPRWVFHQAGVVAIWALALSVLALIARKRSWLWTLVPISLIGLGLWALAVNYYPSDISFKPLAELSILMEDSSLKSAPYKSSKTLREIPSTSPCFIHGSTGEWASVEFPRGITGWVLLRQMAPIQGRNVWHPPSEQID